MVDQDKILLAELNKAFARSLLSGFQNISKRLESRCRANTDTRKKKLGILKKKLGILKKKLGILKE